VPAPVEPEVPPEEFLGPVEPRSLQRCGERGYGRARNAVRATIELQEIDLSLRVQHALHLRQHAAQVAGTT